MESKGWGTNVCVKWADPWVMGALVEALKSGSKKRMGSGTTEMGRRETLIGDCLDVSVQVFISKNSGMIS